jgi:galactonate dehydratase
MSDQLTAHQRAKRQRLAGLADEPRPSAQRPQVAITGVTAVAVQEPVSKRSYLLLSIQTDAGVTGLGEVRAGSDPQAAVNRLLHQKEHLLGQDALAAEAIRQRLARTAGDERPWLLAVVNMALLDILGKVAKAPLYEVLGGPTRHKARALAHLHGSSEAELKESLRRAHQAGYRAFVVPLAPAAGAVRRPTFARRTLALLDGLRQAAGDGADFVLDCRGGLSPAEAVGLARAVERFHLLFLDEPCGPVATSALRKLADETVVPLGLGRQVTHNRSFQELLRADAIDVLRPDFAHLGLSDMRKAAALAETYYVAVAPAHRQGPVTTAAALQVAAAIPNFFIQEIPVPADERDGRMRRELTTPALEAPREGFLPLPAEPGLGVVLNEDAVAEYRVKT